MKRLLSVSLICVGIGTSNLYAEIVNSLAEVHCFGSTVTDPTSATASCTAGLPPFQFSTVSASIDLTTNGLYGRLSVSTSDGPQPGDENTAQASITELFSSPTTMDWVTGGYGGAYGGAPGVILTLGPSTYYCFANDFGPGEACGLPDPIRITLPAGTWTFSLWTEISDQGASNLTASWSVLESVPEQPNTLLLAVMSLAGIFCIQLKCGTK
jgi:hypothetical protein